LTVRQKRFRQNQSQGRGPNRLPDKRRRRPEVRLPLRLAKLEGDAAFVYAVADMIDVCFRTHGGLANKRRIFTPIV